MDKNILNQKIDIILNREKILLNAKKIPWSIIIKDDNKIIKYDHVETFINLYAGLQSSELKDFFINTLAYKFNLEDDEVHTERISDWEYDVVSYSSIGALIFFTLLQLGFINKLIEILKRRTETCLSNKWVNIVLVHFLNDLLLTKKRYFNIELVSQLLNFSNNLINNLGSTYDDLIRNLQLGLADIGYEEVKESILGVNIEINKDKEKLITIFSNNGFDNKYAVLLQEIDDYINTNSTIVSSGMISNMRSFMEDLITDLARKIAANLNEQIPEKENSGPMGNNRNYLKMKLELSDNDNNLMNKYVDILHSEGGHSFTSNVEYFRLAKNIGIEISLFLLSKARNLKLLRNTPVVFTDIDF